MVHCSLQEKNATKLNQRKLTNLHQHKSGKLRSKSVVRQLTSSDCGPSAILCSEFRFAMKSCMDVTAAAPHDVFENKQLTKADCDTIDFVDVTQSF